MGHYDRAREVHEELEDKRALNDRRKLFEVKFQSMTEAERAEFADALHEFWNYSHHNDLTGTKRQHEIFERLRANIRKVI